MQCGKENCSNCPYCIACKFVSVPFLVQSFSGFFKILRSILLFPTIERMAQSSQGKLMTPLLCWLRYILYMPIYLFTLLPEKVKSFFVHFALKQQKLNDETVVTTSIDMLNNMDCIGEFCSFF